MREYRDPRAPLRDGSRCTIHERHFTPAQLHAELGAGEARLEGRFLVAVRVALTEESIMSASQNVNVMLEIFAAIERLDAERFGELVQPDFELHWPPSLPYGGTTVGREPEGPSWGQTWFPLQPGEGDRRMDPRVVAASEEEVVVLWRQRGVSPSGERLDSQVLGLYRLRDGLLARGQMFYFDPARVSEFLASAARPEPASA